MIKLKKIDLIIIISVYLITLYTFKTGIVYNHYKKIFYHDILKRERVLERRENKFSERWQILKDREKIVKKKEKTFPLCDTEECTNRHFNKCVYDEIPLVSTQLETAQYLRYTNSSLIRFGDSEINLILGLEVDKQKPYSELSRRMNESFHCTNDNIALAIPNAFCNYPYYDEATTKFWRQQYEIREWILKNYNHSRQYLDAHITAVYIITSTTHCVNIEKFYENMREIWRDKDIVIMRGNNGEEYEYDVYDTAKSQTVYYGLARNSWSKYKEYKNLLMKEDPNKLFIISLGHLSKILVYDLAMKGRRALDLGHLAKDYDYYMKKLDPTYEFFGV